MLETLHLIPTQASTVARQVDGLFLYLTVVSAFFALLIAGLVVRFMVRYRRRSADERGTPVHGSLVLEAVWTGIPFVIALVAFFWGAGIYAALQRPPDNALEIQVVGKQWMWKMQHLEGRREINTLHVPVGRPVKLTLTSEDVIHSFFVPAFRIKQDALPGRYTTTWFEATRPGRYHLFCAEYCGTLHAGMIGEIVAMDQAAFQAWLADTDGAGGESVSSRGARLFAAQGCTSCHRSDAVARGPSLENLAGRSVKLADGQTVRATDDYLRESILNPQARVVAGYDPIMPTYQGLLSEEQVLELVTYIKSMGAGDDRGLGDG